MGGYNQRLAARQQYVTIHAARDSKCVSTPCFKGTLEHLRLRRRQRSAIPQLVL